MQRNSAGYKAVALAIAANALPVMAGAAQAQTAPANAGQALFQQRCQMCHVNDASGRNGVGPNLYRLRGRAAGVQPKFAYSAALKASKVTWSRETLDTFLIAPNKMVPGTKMVVTVPDAKQRAALVAYLMK